MLKPSRLGWNCSFAGYVQQMAALEISCVLQLSHIPTRAVVRSFLPYVSIVQYHT